MAGHNDPRVLYSIPNIKAYHIQNGEESALTPSGPQVLSLLMVPTHSPFADLSTSRPQSEAPEEDFYLHLHLPPELDLPLPATTQIYHQPPTSYLIPRWDLGPGSGAFTRIEFPGVGSGEGKVTQEDVDTFETILAQCTAFLERSAPPSAFPNEKGGKSMAYNPSTYAPGEGYASGTAGRPTGHGHIVLVDEENGSVVGELSEGFQIVEDEKLKPGSKTPVEIQLPTDSSQMISVAPADPEFLRMTEHPAYKNSSLVSGAATASRLIITTSNYLSGAMTSSATSFTQKTKPNTKPMTFSPATHDRVRKVHGLSEGAAGLSSRTVGQVSKVAQNIGASMTRRGERKTRGYDEQGNPVSDYKPGILNKSMMAFSTIADGIEHSAKDLLNSGSTAATTVVGHKYGKEAAGIAGSVTGGVKNVGLVYIDATGVSRKAIVKSVAKGMVVGKVKGGGQVIVGGGDGGVILSEKEQLKRKESETSSVAGETVVGFGNQPPPSYSSGVGEPIAGQPAVGRDEKGRYT
ncbi:MAG: hypothetical protein M1814_001164 [Vezdaea aestivalis]|nr:MAG: hypothetical protein M1814_001164 [Vezdaea aestivalis]